MNKKDRIALYLFGTALIIGIFLIGFELIGINHHLDTIQEHLNYISNDVRGIRNSEM